MCIMKHSLKKEARFLHYTNCRLFWVHLAGEFHAHDLVSRIVLFPYNLLVARSSNTDKLSGKMSRTRLDHLEYVLNCICF
jgi:hypothetical protein